MPLHLSLPQARIILNTIVGNVSVGNTPVGFYSRHQALCSLYYLAVGSRVITTGTTDSLSRGVQLNPTTDCSFF